MTWDLVGLLGICVVVAAWGIYRYNQAEEISNSHQSKALLNLKSDIALVNQRIDAHVVDLKLIFGRLDSLVNQCSILQEGSNTFSKEVHSEIYEMRRDVEEAQEHLSKMRDSQMSLDKRALPQIIQLEIKETPKPKKIMQKKISKKDRLLALKKLKGQVRGLSV